MTKGLVRYQQCGCFHFLTFSCYRRLPYLGTETARSLFERSLETIRLRYDFVVCGYVVMPGARSSAGQRTEGGVAQQGYSSIEAVRVGSESGTPVLASALLRFQRA